MISYGNDSLVNEARKLAYFGHSLQKYGDYPYSVHLDKAVSFVEEIINKSANELSSYDAIDLNAVARELIASAYLHDLLEDAGFAANYNDISNKFGTICADICYALQTPKGKNRKQRHSAEYFDGIRETHFAFFIKIADRYANIKFSYDTGSSMLGKYLQEHKNLVEIWNKKVYISRVERSLTQNAWYKLENLVHDITR